MQFGTSFAKKLLQPRGTKPVDRRSHPSASTDGMGGFAIVARAAQMHLRRHHSSAASSSWRRRPARDVRLQEHYPHSALAERIPACEVGIRREGIFGSMQDRLGNPTFPNPRYSRKRRAS